MRLFHGANVKFLESILENGISGNKAEGFESRGSVFTSPKADIAFAYAGMLGGELNCSGYLKDNERVLLILDIDEDWYDNHFVRSVEGTCPEVSFDIDIPCKFIVDYVVADRKEVYEYL